MFRGTCKSASDVAVTVVDRDFVLVSLVRKDTLPFPFRTDASQPIRIQAEFTESGVRMRRFRDLRTKLTCMRRCDTVKTLPYDFQWIYEYGLPL